MTEKENCWAVIPAAGSGQRMGSDIPKQYMKLDGMTILEHSMHNLINDSRILGLYLVVDFDKDFHSELPKLRNSKIKLVHGGAERSDSVLAGLTALMNDAEERDWVLVHDAARPCVKAEEIHSLIEVVTRSGIGGILAQPIVDTVKRVDKEGLVQGTMQRETLWRALTPQMFSLGLLLESVLAAKEADVSITDEAAAMEYMGHNVQLIPGLSTNIKITFPSDIAFARYFLNSTQVNLSFISEIS